MLATNPRIVSLKINNITADKAPIAVKKVLISFPVINEKIIKIPRNQTTIKHTCTKLSIGLSFKDSIVFK